MLTAEQCAQAFTRVPGGQPVTIEDDISATTQSVREAKYRRLSASEMAASFGRYRGTDALWRFRCSEVAAQPRLGARIVEASGTKHTILDVSKDLLGSVYSCTARNLVIDGSLTDIVTVQRMVIGEDVHGTPTRSWVDVAADVPARVQRTNGAPTIEFEGRTFVVDYQVYMAEQYVTDERHRLIYGESVLSIVSWRRPDSIGELFSFDATEDPWPL